MQIAGSAILPSSLQNDVVFAYSFDQFTWNQPYSLRSDYPSGLTSWVIRGIWQTSPGLLSPPLEPALIASDSPAVGSPAIVYKQMAVGAPLDLVLGTAAGAIFRIPPFCETLSYNRGYRQYCDPRTTSEWFYFSALCARASHWKPALECRSSAHCIYWCHIRWILFGSKR
jgi:hypothetical protein